MTQQAASTVAPTTKSGVTLPKGTLSPANYVGDPNLGQFIDWGSEFLSKGEAPPAEANEHGTPSWYMGRPTGFGKLGFVMKGGTGTGQPYAPGVVGADPYDGSGAAQPPPSAPQAGGQPAPAGVPPSAAMSGDAPVMPFASQLAPMMAAMHRGGGEEPPAPQRTPAPPASPPRAVPAPAPTPPIVAKMEQEAIAAHDAMNGWIDWEPHLVALMGPEMAATMCGPKMGHGGVPGMPAPVSGKMGDGASGTGGRGAERKPFTYGEDDQGGGVEAPAEKAMRTFDDLMKGLVELFEPLEKAGGHKYKKRIPKPGGGYRYVYDDDKSGGRQTSLFEPTAPGKEAAIPEARNEVSKHMRAGGPGMYKVRDYIKKRYPGSDDRQIAEHIYLGMKFDPTTTLEHVRKVRQYAAQQATAKRGGHTGGAEPKSVFEDHVAERVHDLETELRQSQAFHKKRDAAHAASKAAHEAQADARLYPSSYNDRAKAASEHLNASTLHREAARLAGDDKIAAHHKKQSDYHLEQSRKLRDAHAAPKAEKSMDSTDIYGRPLKKGLYAFRDSTGTDAEVPDSLLYDYLCAFIEEAYEHESREREHADLNAKEQLSQMARAIMNELVTTIPRNRNLMRATTKYSVTTSVIEQLLVAKGIYKPRADSEWRSDADGNAAMGASFAYSLPPSPWMQSEPAPRVGRTLVDHTPANVASLVKAEVVDPFEAIRSREAARVHALWPGSAPAEVRISPECQVHGGRDITKAQNLWNPMLPCTCSGTPNAHG